MENAKRKNQRGAMMVFFAILLPFLFGLMGLAIDASVLYLQKGKLQDVADAAALAGAAHLGDENRQKGVADAVLAYVKGNGINVNSNSMKDLADTSAPTQKGTTYVKWGIVNVDGVDRVRVRITQGVPVYFVSVLLDDYRQSGVNVTSAAAATGEVQPAVANIGGPAIIATEGAIEFHSTKIFGKEGSNGRGLGNDIYANGGINLIDNQPLQLYGSYYTNREYNKINVHGKDEGFKSIYDGDPSHTWVEESLRKEIAAMNQKVKDIYSECKNFTSNANKDSYIRGEENKIFIDRLGIQPSGMEIVSGKSYDIYLDASNMSMDGHDQEDWRSIITNEYFKGITKINTLVIDLSSTQSFILNTNGMTFGNVYTKVGGYIEGSNNNFTGVIYNENQVDFMGNDNRYTQVIAKNVRVGYGYHFESGRDGAADKNWQCFFTPKGEEDSDGSSGTTSKLRLVE